MFKWVKKLFKNNANEVETLKNEIYATRVKYLALEVILMSILKDNDYCISISKDSFNYVKENGHNLKLEYSENGEDSLVSLIIVSE